MLSWKPELGEAGEAERRPGGGEGMYFRLPLWPPPQLRGIKWERRLGETEACGAGAVPTAPMAPGHSCDPSGCFTMPRAQCGLMSCSPFGVACSPPSGPLHLRSSGSTSLKKGLIPSSVPQGSRTPPHNSCYPPCHVLPLSVAPTPIAVPNTGSTAPRTQQQDTWLGVEPS